MPNVKHLNSFIEFLESAITVSPEMKKELTESIKIRRVNKEEFVIQEGELCTKLFFLCKGLFRSFYFTEKGDERTSAFSFEKEFFTNVRGFVNNTLSNESIQALEISYIGVIERNTYVQILQKYPTLLKLSHDIINKLRVELEDRIRMLQSNKAKDKITFFENYYPGLIKKVAKKHVASFLGMRYETLNRVLK